jgi:hypothetical protein
MILDQLQLVPSGDDSGPRSRDVISSRPPAKNDRLLTWAGPATFTLQNYPLSCFIHSKLQKNILCLFKKSLHHWLKRNIAFHHWLKKTLLRSILKHDKTKF